MFRKKLARRRPYEIAEKRAPKMQYYRGAPSAAPAGVGQGRRAVRNPEKKAPQSERLVLHARRLPYYLSSLLIVLSLVYCSILGNKATVVLSTETTLHPKSYYEDQASKILNQSLLNHSKLTINTIAFKADLLKQLPDVSDVSISIPLVGRKPVVGLSMTQPLFLLKTTSGSYVVGSNGVVLANTRDIDIAVIEGLRTLQEDAPVPVTVGKAVVTTGDIAFIQTIITELERVNLTVSDLILPLGANELQVRIQGLPYFVKFSLGGEVKQQVGAFIAVKNTLGTDVPQEYIDVRIGERAYVK